MESTIIELVISEAQKEVRDFHKWGFDIIPHRMMMKNGFQTPDGKRVAVEVHEDLSPGLRLAGDGEIEQARAEVEHARRVERPLVALAEGVGGELLRRSIVVTEEIALDAIALKRLDEWRAKENFPPVGRLASYVQTATTVGLGNSDLSRIEVKNVGR